MSLFDSATGKWPAILKALGFDDRHLRNRQTDCPMCGGNTRYRFDDKGVGMWICNHCGAGNGYTLIRRVLGWDHPRIVEELKKLLRLDLPMTSIKKENLDKNRKRLIELMEGCVVSDINPVRAYLTSRKLKPVPSLHYHPAVPYWDDGTLLGKFPAMIAKITTPDSFVSSLHITYLTPQGNKLDVVAAKKIMPKCRELTGSAIRLFPAENKTIGIAEGIETALAVTKMYEIPCWAASNATLLAAFEPPDDIECIHIFADNDANFVGQAAAYNLAQRLANSYIVSVNVPPLMGQDYADMVI